MTWQQFYRRRKYAGSNKDERPEPIPTLTIKARLKPRQDVLIQVMSEVAKPTWRVAGELAVRCKSGGKRFTHSEHVLRINRGPYWYTMPNHPEGFQFKSVPWLWDYEITLWRWTGELPPEQLDIPGLTASEETIRITL